MATSPAFKALVGKQQQFLTHYRAGAFTEALKLIDECIRGADEAGWKQGYYEMMRERTAELIDDSPADWNGVHVAKEK